MSIFNPNIIKDETDLIRKTDELMFEKLRDMVSDSINKEIINKFKELENKIKQI